MNRTLSLFRSKPAALAGLVATALGAAYLLSIPAPAESARSAGPHLSLSKKTLEAPAFLAEQGLTESAVKSLNRLAHDPPNDISLAGSRSSRKSGAARLFASESDAGNVCSIAVVGPLDRAQSSKACVNADAFNARGTGTNLVVFDGKVWVTGLVPDGVASVRIAFQDGTTGEIKVSNNGFIADVTHHPTVELRWKNPVGDDISESLIAPALFE